MQLLWKVPDADFLQSLQDGLTERAHASARIVPLLGEGWRRMGKVLEQKRFDEVADDYTRLFLGPHHPAMTPYESFYLTGTLFREPLIVVRQFIEQAGLEKDHEKFPEPEDVLAFELEIMNWLVEKEK